MRRDPNNVARGGPPIKPDGKTRNAPVERWIGRREIASIEGALKAAAYVQRAYLYSRDHGGDQPPWARKTEQGRWLFDPDYIEADAADNLRTITVGDAARLAGATRRTIQNWIDEGDIAILGGRHVRGRDRRILKEAFLAKLDVLKTRLETPAVIGQKLQRGKPVPDAVLRRVSPARKPESKLQAAKILSAAALEAQLAAARAVHRADDDGQEDTAEEFGAPARAGAEMLESRLRAAREAHVSRAAIERYACEVAERLVNDVYDDRLTRIDAVMLFNRIAEERGVPRDIRIKVRKRFFGR